MNENAHGESSGPRATPEVSVADTITIFFSDIRGFTDTTEELGDEAANELVREQDFIVRSHIEAYGGDVVKTQGDSFMVAFKATRGAILCAIGIQKSVAEKNSNQAGPRIAIGIGINTGEPIRQKGGDYIGGTVNLAARICAAAGPGQILVAESTRYVAGRIELRRSDGGGVVEYVDRGLHPLKGFPEPKRLFEVTWHPTPGAARNRPSVALGRRDADRRPQGGGPASDRRADARARHHSHGRSRVSIAPRVSGEGQTASREVLPRRHRRARPRSAERAGGDPTVRGSADPNARARHVDRRALGAARRRGRPRVRTDSHELRGARPAVDHHGREAGSGAVPVGVHQRAAERAGARPRRDRAKLRPQRAGSPAARRARNQRSLVGRRVCGVEPVEAVGARLGSRAARGDRAVPVPLERSHPDRRGPRRGTAGGGLLPAARARRKRLPRVHAHGLRPRGRRRRS